MRLWSIQPRVLWDTLQAEGSLSGNPAYVWPGFWAAYDWMMLQMRRRIGPPPQPATLPMWAWARWTAASPRPDLRSRGHLERGTAGVRMELEVDPARVLLSDFELWHYALNYWYLDATDQEEIYVEAALEARRLNPYRQEPLADEDWHLRILASWDRIFDLDGSAMKRGWPPERKSIQAVLWEIRRNDVRRVQFFSAR
ncbi:MAG TPA: DUF3841 domain-containing protein [Herpetosiphonaceae bacterium]|nr:DUF3841 domain-containing protein [Herpetosiphonaceae bacterium]